MRGVTELPQPIEAWATRHRPVLTAFRVRAVVCGAFRRDSARRIPLRRRGRDGRAAVRGSSHPFRQALRQDRRADSAVDRCATSAQA